MPNRRALMLTAVLGLGTLIAALGGPITAANAGGQFGVNTTTKGNQWLNAIARLANERFVVVWESDSGPNRADVFAQLFSSSGARFGVNFPVSAGRGKQTVPAVAALTDGSFVVVWVSDTQNPNGTVYGQLFAANGTYLGRPFRIGDPSSAQATPQVSALSDGGFVVVWASSPDGSSDSSYDIVGRRFSVDGTGVGHQFRANKDRAGAQMRPSVAGRADGGFTVVWDSAEDDGSGGTDYFIRGQSFAADGSRSGVGLIVKRGVSELKRPRIATLVGGGFVVTWEAANRRLTPVSNVYAQRYSEADTQVGGLIRVHQSSRSEVNPAVGGLANGGFVVAWSNDSFANILVQRYAGDGALVGNAVRVNEKTDAIRDWAGIAPSGDGGFAVSWDGQDGSALGVFGRTFKQ